MDPQNTRIGRPKKRKKKYQRPTAVCHPVTDQPEWTEESTCFGVIKRFPDGSVVLPPGLFEEIDQNIRRLSESMNEFNE